MKNLSLLTLASATLLLASCGTKTPPESDLRTLTGTVVEGEFEGTETNGRLTTSAWTGGAGSVRGYLADAEGPAAQPAVTGTLAADGKFSLTLPTPTAAQLTELNADDWDDLGEDYALTEDCTPTLKVSTSGVRGASLMLEVDAGKDGAILPFAYSASEGANSGKLDVRFGTLIYVDRSVTIEGSKTCTVEGNSFTTRVDLRLGKGWNKVQVTVSADEATKKFSSSITSGNFTSDNWVYLEGGMSPLSTQSKLPKPSFLGR
ncbi:hypothetical protein QOL99_00435 [Deinococcus sp. MIMF12]|uniref:Lipoprotein n=1 Tax=Deinococcus rhizophilus TaxID=3049544 RepID=A0ABT7JC45_9DEIO|nr:hypothetical protein [Deinococcus rhizophilus]MDL2342613.1 hypothetical protein [Deinococcus rhizophilus]